MPDLRALQMTTDLFDYIVSHSSTDPIYRQIQEDTLRSALEALKNFWVYSGIVLIVLLTLIALAVIVGVALPSALPDFPLK